MGFLVEYRLLRDHSLQALVVNRETKLPVLVEHDVDPDVFDEDMRDKIAAAVGRDVDGTSVFYTYIPLNVLWRQHRPKGWLRGLWFDLVWLWREKVSWPVSFRVGGWWWKLKLKLGLVKDECDGCSDL